MPGLYHSVFACQPVDDLFTAKGQLRAMLAFEQALARAQAAVGVVPAPAATVIATVCAEEAWELEQLAEQTLLAGNPAIPLVNALRRRVARRDADAANYVHFGATSQDVLDTALQLQLRAAISYIQQESKILQTALAALGSAHRDTQMAGRTLLQQARPVTFGFKVAGWLDALMRASQRLEQRLSETLVLQLGGAVGTLATLGTAGPAIAAMLADELGLSVPALPWHGQRDRLADLAAAVGLFTGTLGKMGHDLILLMQTEVGEVAEGAAPGKGGSSAMPHKRNPVAATFLAAIAGRTPALVATLLSALPQHEHERAAGAWHLEWEVLPELLRLTGAALHHANDLISGLEVNPGRMLHNLHLTQGLLFAEDATAALAPHLGKAAAHELVELASKSALQTSQPLQQVLQAHPQAGPLLSAAQWDELFDPARATGFSQHVTDAVLARFYASTSA
jgi:3-carboxy-cis,cis-muconate cycloisomerase